MDQNQTVPLSTTSAELLQAQAKLWCHSLRYIESMALKCAVDLGIPQAIHSNNGSASLSELLATLPVAANKKPFLSRLMRLLTISGIFREEISKDGTESVYQLTAVSCLLVDGIFINLSPFVTEPIKSHMYHAFLGLGEWFQDDGDKTPFAMVHGFDFWDVVSHDAKVGMGFNAAMASDSHFVAEIAIREYAESFKSIKSLVDVGGGNGSMARTIAKAFPHIKCSVLDLPHVIHDVPADGMVEYIAGDMMDFVPAADVVLLKFVLHDWSDEDCVRILTRCREAISSGQGSRVIIMDTVIGSQSKEILEAQVKMDLCMMALLTGKEREEKEWHKIFLQAGFSHSKIMPMLGVKSIIEVYP